VGAGDGYNVHTADLREGAQAAAIATAAGWLAVDLCRAAGGAEIPEFRSDSLELSQDGGTRRDALRRVDPYVIMGIEDA
jgi:hypothetical protein